MLKIIAWLFLFFSPICSLFNFSVLRPFFPLLGNILEGSEKRSSAEFVICKCLVSDLIDVTSLMFFGETRKEVLHTNPTDT